ncbi:class I SAM-dependent methyltransferase [Paenirhodobacter sp.]|uniref:class I SAM-dependent methyltransferase n=1 Tax=Paenirhodobacter sp. TaxID=1965326 RepID=UPI003B3C2854
MVTPEHRTGAGLLLETLEGPIRHALLDWALTVGIFDLCADPAPVDDLAAALHLRPDRLLTVLRALAAAGFVRPEAAGFRTAPEVLPFVATGSPRNMVETLRALATTRHTGLDRIAALLAGGDEAPGKPLFDAAHWDASHRSLAAFHRALAADAMEPCLTGLPEWPRARTLLDIGPGSAVLARRLLARRPDLRVTLFDLPPVAERIRHDAADLPVAILGGSYNETLPEGPFDIIWCSMTLYFHDRGLPALIARLAERLAPGGVLVSFHEALTDARTAPPEHVIGRLMPALRSGDTSFTEGEIARAMAGAGLLRASVETIFTPFGRYRLDSARKGPARPCSIDPNIAPGGG